MMSSSLLAVVEDTIPKAVNLSLESLNAWNKVFHFTIIMRIPSYMQFRKTFVSQNIENQANKPCLPQTL